MRIYACCCGGQPHIMTTQVQKPKSMVGCVACDTVTHQHETPREAVDEWNDSGGIIWRRFGNYSTFGKMKLRFLRWFHGRNV